MLDELITNKALSKRLHVTPRTLYKWASQPELNFPAHCLICGRRYFSAAAVDAWLESHWPGNTAKVSAAPEAAAIVAQDLGKLHRNRMAQKPSPIDRRNASEVTEAR